MEALIITICTLALLVGLLVSIRSAYGYFSGTHFVTIDRALGLFFILFIYSCLAIKLFVFFTSSYTYEASFTAIEQMALMLVAVLSAQTGRLISLRSGDDTIKFRFRAIFYSIATGLLIYNTVL